MRDADTVFTGQRQNKLFLPAAQHDINRHTALTGGFLSALAASYDPDYDSTDDADGLYAGRQAYHLAKRGSGYDRFSPPVLARKPTTSRLINTFRPSPFANGSVASTSR